jgi:hypothetical protein
MLSYSYVGAYRWVGTLHWQGPAVYRDSLARELDQSNFDLGQHQFRYLDLFRPLLQTLPPCQISYFKNRGQPCHHTKGYMTVLGHSLSV